MLCLYDVETARNKWTEIAHYLQQDGVALGADSQGGAGVHTYAGVNVPRRCQNSCRHAARIHAVRNLPLVLDCQGFLAEFFPDFLRLSSSVIFRFQYGIPASAKPFRLPKSYGLRRLRCFRRLRHCSHHFRLLRRRRPGHKSLSGGYRWHSAL